MKEKLQSVISAVFSLFIIIAILGGGIVFCMFVIALIIGGDVGASLASNASKVVMPYFIRSASIAVLAGLVSFYITKEHALSLEENGKELSEV